MEKKNNRKWKWKWHPSGTGALEQTGGEEEQKDSGVEIVPIRKWCMGTNWYRKTTTARLGHGNGAHQELVHGNKLAVKKNRNQE